MLPNPTTTRVYPGSGWDGSTLVAEHSTCHHCNQHTPLDPEADAKKIYDFLQGRVPSKTTAAVAQLFKKAYGWT
jgi:hypothetical protein